MKHLIITKIFEFGGSNSHLKSLIRYLGKDQVVFVLESDEQARLLRQMENGHHFHIVIKPRLQPYAHLTYPSVLSNLKQAFFLLRSSVIILWLMIRHNLADLTVCAVEPEKFLYFFWLPIVRVTYILHTSPPGMYTKFTAYTCNKRLGKRKKVVTVSLSHRREVLENWHISKQKSASVHVVPNCLPDEVVCTDQPENPGKQEVLTLGHVIGYKNPETWLKVAQVVTAARESISFTWLGNGPLWDEFREITRNNARIRFKGAVKDPYTHLQDAAIYYQPSLNETQGIAVIEAMAHGLPCVVSDVGGLPESVEQDHNGFLVPPCDVEQHAAAILCLADDAGLRNAFGKNSSLKYKQLFSFEVFSHNMDKIR